LEVKGKRILQNKSHHGKDETVCPPMDGRKPTESSISGIFLNPVNNKHYDTEAQSKTKEYFIIHL
jgi:hypothetical protein